MNAKIKSPPSPVQTHIRSIYPWDSDFIKRIYYSIYQQALNTGYANTFEDFQNTLGEFFTTLSNVEWYKGNYIITPLPDVEQILKTTNRLLEQDVIIEKIPYYETSNDAGGYTVIIG